MKFAIKKIPHEDQRNVWHRYPWKLFVIFDDNPSVGHWLMHATTYNRIKENKAVYEREGIVSLREKIEWMKQTFKNDGTVNWYNIKTQ